MNKEQAVQSACFLVLEPDAKSQRLHHYLLQVAAIRHPHARLDGRAQVKDIE